MCANFSKCDIYYSFAYSLTPMKIHFFVVLLGPSSSLRTADLTSSTQENVGFDCCRPLVLDLDLLGSPLLNRSEVIKAEINKGLKQLITSDITYNHADLLVFIESVLMTVKPLEFHFTQTMHN